MLNKKVPRGEFKNLEVFIKSAIKKVPFSEFLRRKILTIDFKV
jgi:hypothetical protein